jgi:hypothetical protein
MQAGYDIPGFHIVARLHALQFTILRLAAGRPMRVTPAEIAAALRTTTLHEDELLFQH